MYGQRNQALCMFEPLMILNLNVDVSINMEPETEENIILEWEFSRNVNLVCCQKIFSRYSNSIAMESVLFPKYKHVHLFQYTFFFAEYSAKCLYQNFPGHRSDQATFIMTFPFSHYIWLKIKKKKKVVFRFQNSTYNSTTMWTSEVGLL